MKKLMFVCTFILSLLIIGNVNVSAKATTVTVYEGQCFEIPINFSNYDLNDITIKLNGNIIKDEYCYGFNSNSWNLDSGKLNLIACSKSNTNSVKFYYKNKLIKTVKIKIKPNTFSGNGTFILKWSLVDTNEPSYLFNADEFKLFENKGSLNVGSRDYVVNRYEGTFENGCPTSTWWN